MWSSSLLAFFVASTAVAQGFGPEVFSPAPAGASWLALDDLNISGGIGGAVSATTSLSTNVAFIDVGGALTWKRFRLAADLPLPLWISRTLDIGTSPDTVEDPRLSFDARLFGEPGEMFRLGMSASVFLPSEQGVSLGIVREEVRLLAAGDPGRFSYAAQLGALLRPGFGDRLVYGVGASGHVDRDSWKGALGPEIFGESDLHQTGVEALLMARIEHAGWRLKLGAGAGAAPHPQWRVVFSAERFSSSIAR